MTSIKSKPFWETKTLSEMKNDEWESLCDGCAQCCLHKMEDVDSGEVAITNVACQLLDLQTCRCKAYETRRMVVKDCVQLTPKDVPNLSWLPKTCAYRLIDEGDSLPDWHPLISKDKESVHQADHSVRGKVVSEDDVDDLEDYVMHWLKAGNMPFNL